MSRTLRVISGFKAGYVTILLLAEIRLSPVEVGSLSHYLQGFCTCQLVQDFSQQQYHKVQYPSNREKEAADRVLVDCVVGEWYRKRKSSTELITDKIYIYTHYRDLRTYSFMQTSQKVVPYLNLILFVVISCLRYIIEGSLNRNFRQYGQLKSRVE